MKERKIEGMAKLKEAFKVAKQTGNSKKILINPLDGTKKEIEKFEFTYSDEIKRTDLKRDDFVFFWHSNSPYSQWHPSIFVVNNVKFTSAEQFMMYCKAKLFKNDDIAQLIIDVNKSYKITYDSDGNIKNKEPSVVKKFYDGNITSLDILNDFKLRKEWDSYQKKIKNFGRKVRNFEEKLWLSHREHYVSKGSYAKYTQNELLKKLLIGNARKIFAEANPFDKVWGIALKEFDSIAIIPSKWRGLNLLGKILTNLREQLILDMKNNP